MEKCSESTIHLALPVWSLRLTWREEFARFPDNESRKLPATEVSTRECDRCMMRPLNIVPIRSYDLDASESQFHRESFPREGPCSDRLTRLVISRRDRSCENVVIINNI